MTEASNLDDPPVLTRHLSLCQSGFKILLEQLC